MTIISTDGAFVHNLLEAPGTFLTTFIAPGCRSFTLTTGKHIIVRDILLKWSEDGANKTAWQVTKIDHKGEYPNKVYHGEMEDIIFHKRMTARLQVDIRRADGDFVKRGL